MALSDIPAGTSINDFLALVFPSVGAPDPDNIASYFPHDPACAATAAASALPFKAKRFAVVAELEKRSFYPTADFGRMIDAVWALIDRGVAKMQEARSDPWLSKKLAGTVQESLYARKKASQRFLDAYHNAVANGITVIDAPDWYDYVNTALQQVEMAFGTFAFLACEKPAWLTVLSWFTSAADTLVSIAKTAVSTAIAVGATVLSIPRTIMNWWGLIKIGVVVGGGYYLYKRYGHKLPGGSG